MKEPGRHIFSVRSLAADWRAFALVLVIFARSFYRQEQAGRPGARAHTENLERFVCCSLVSINRQIALVSQLDDRSPEDEEALGQMKVTAISLLRLALILQLIKQQIMPAGEAYAGHDFCIYSTKVPAAVHARGGHYAECLPGGYFDTS